MAFNCSVILSDIDINCQALDVGGIAKVALGLQSDLSITFDSQNETHITDISLNNAVIFEHNKKDGTTVFTESKSVNQGLGVIRTEITIRLPRVDNKINDIDYMSRRSDIVCLMLHNNGSVTVSGWMDGLNMNYQASSGTGIQSKSYVDVNLETTSWIASMVMDNTSAFAVNPFE